MNPNLERGILLYQQSRHELAEAELRQSLANEPQDGYAHALLALCMAEQQKLSDATEEARQAIHLAPDFPFAHYALARVLYERNHYPEALEAVSEAIRLDSSDADYFWMLAVIHFDEKRWQQTLEASEQGLRLDPEHIGCTNLRAMAMVKLGRKAEAGATIGAALRKNPENSVTHANHGWTMLEHGEYQKALEHFRESLRLDPDNEWARQGIVEALKARHFVYSIMLRYFLWMSKLSRQAQWFLIIGAYVGNRMLATAAKTNPDLAPWILPLRILYLTFVLLTWTADPLFNLVLRLNRFGRLALSREQIAASNWIGSCILLALLSLCAGAVFGFDTPCLMAAMVFGFLIIPMAGTFHCQSGWPRTVMAFYTGLMAATGIAALIFLFMASAEGAQNAKFFGRLGGVLLIPVFIGAIASGWVANILMSHRVRK